MLLASSSNIWFEGLFKITREIGGISLTFKFYSRRHFSWWTKYNCEFVQEIICVVTKSSKWPNVEWRLKSRCLIGWTRFWSGYFDHSYLLHPSIPPEWSRKFFIYFIVILLTYLPLDRTKHHSKLVGVSKFKLVLRKSQLLRTCCGFRNTVPFIGADGFGTPIRPSPLAPGDTFGWVEIIHHFFASRLLLFC